MSRKPHSRIKRVSDTTIRVEKKPVKTQIGNVVKNILGSLIKK